MFYSKGKKLIRRWINSKKMINCVCKIKTQTFRKRVLLCFSFVTEWTHHFMMIFEAHAAFHPSPLDFSSLEKRRRVHLDKDGEFLSIPNLKDVSGFWYASMTTWTQPFQNQKNHPVVKLNEKFFHEFDWDKKKLT